MSATVIVPGFTFRHPLVQDLCTVVSVSPKAVRYSAPPRVPGFSPRYYTTTPGALAASLGLVGGPSVVASGEGGLPGQSTE